MKLSRSTKTGRHPAGNQHAGSEPAARAAVGAGNTAEFLGRPARWDRLFGFVLVAVTLVAYRPALLGNFVWDDDRWTLGVVRLLRGFSGLCRMWFEPGALMQYYPLTGTTFWLDYQFWGFWSPPYHIENVLLHAFAALLFWRLLRRLQVPGSWLAGAILALHPLMVESVGWITERKNVLSLVLYLGALFSYGKFDRFWQCDNAADGNGAKELPARPRGAYVASLLLFVAALLAKTTAFSVPAAILLLCWWKRGRIRWRADVLPVLPFFALAIGLGLVTASVERHNVGAEGSEWALSVAQRCLLAGRAVWFYAAKLFWPVNLCFVYPRWQLDAASPAQWLYPIGAILALLALWLARGRIGRGPATAFFFFAGTLLPVLGFMNAYYMRYSFVCDHWVYVSALGLVALTAALVVQVCERVRVPAAVIGFAAILLPVLAVLTWRQSGAFADMETLWRTTLAKNPDSFMPQNNLALLLLQKGQLDEAKAHFQKALDLRPDLPGGHNNLGYVLLQTGQVDGAIPYFEKALKISPDFAEAHQNLGLALVRTGRLGDAVAHFDAALKIQPTNVLVLYNLSWVLGTCSDPSLRNGSKAVEMGERADRLSGGESPVILGVLAAAYAEAGRFQEAVAAARRAMELPACQTKPAWLDLLQNQIALYEAGIPFRDSALTNGAVSSKP